MRRSPTTDVAVLNRINMVTEALMIDWARLLSVLEVAQRDNLRAAGWTGPAGKGGYSDPTGNLRLTPDGKEVLEDPAAADLIAAGKYLQQMLTGAVGLRGIELKWLRDPASANWCCNAYGCPTRSKAEPGRRGRCETCYRAWYRTCPADEDQRVDRETAGKVAC